jgi:hypothetical protein
MIHFSDKICRENQNPHCKLINVFPKLCRLRDNVKKYGSANQATDNNIIWRMHLACWVNKATDTHSEYIILIDFSRQQWLR